MKRIRLLLFFIVGLILPWQAAAQSEGRFAIGVQGNQMGEKLGIGFNVTSPTFLERCAVRVSTDLLWSNQIDFRESGWKRTKFWNVKAGLMGTLLEFGKSSQLYLEAGFITIIPNPRVPADIGFGAYLQIGAECALAKRLGIFIELGFTGYQTDLKQAILNDGLYYENAHFSQLVSTGFRFYIP